MWKKSKLKLLAGFLCLLTIGLGAIVPTEDEKKINKLSVTSEDTGVEKQEQDLLYPSNSCSFFQGACQLCRKELQEDEAFRRIGEHFTKSFKECLDISTNQNDQDPANLICTAVSEVIKHVCELDTSLVPVGKEVTIFKTNFDKYYYDEFDDTRLATHAFCRSLKNSYVSLRHRGLPSIHSENVSKLWDESFLDLELYLYPSCNEACLSNSTKSNKKQPFVVRPTCIMIMSVYELDLAASDSGYSSGSVNTPTTHMTHVTKQKSKTTISLSQKGFPYAPTKKRPEKTSTALFEKDDSAARSDNGRTFMRDQLTSSVRTYFGDYSNRKLSNLELDERNDKAEKPEYRNPPANERNLFAEEEQKLASMIDQHSFRIDPVPDEGNGVNYMILLIIVSIAVYAAFQNKNRIVAFVVEGRRPDRDKRRSSSRTRYRRLDM